MDALLGWLVASAIYLFTLLGVSHYLMGVRLECWRTSICRFYSKLGFDRKKNISCTITSSSTKNNVVELLKYEIV